MTLKNLFSKKYLYSVAIVAVAVFFVVFAVKAFAATPIHWTGATSTDWNTASNWQEGQVPDSNSDVIIDGGTNQPTLDLASGTVTVHSLMLGQTNSATLTVANGKKDTNMLAITQDMQVLASGTLTHAANTSSQSSVLAVTVGGDVTIASGGKIDVSGKGFAGGYGPGNTGASTGAAYGGNADGGLAYGSITTPTDLGSGGRGGYGGGGGAGGQGGSTGGAYPAGGGTGITGGAKPNYSSCPNGGNGSTSTTGAGGAGGSGVLCYTNGKGGNGGAGGSGGAGGGAVYLTVSGSVTNNGAIIANGTAGGAGATGLSGASGSSGGGGGAGGEGGAGGSGGSIYITSASLSSANTSITANGGAGGTGGAGANGGSGGGYTNSGPGLAGTAGTLGSSGAGGRIAVYATNGAPSSALFVAKAGDGVTKAAPGTIFSSTNSTSAGVFVVDNGSLLSTYTTPFSTIPSGSSTTIGYGAVADFGTLTSAASPLVVNSFTVKTNGAATGQRIDVTASGNITTETGSTLTVAAKGFAGGQGAGAGTQAASTSSGGSGAGYGGVGGAGLVGAGGAVYGSETEPTDLGSGGGNTSAGTGGGVGGGAIRLISSDTVAVAGTLNANGGGFSVARAAGGAGGTVYLSAPNVSNAATLTANGGAGSASYGGGGAGGRIAVNKTSTMSIDSISPSKAGIQGGNTITINGTGFSTSSKVAFTTVSAADNSQTYTGYGTVTAATPSKLTVTVPSAPYAGTTTVAVSDDNNISNAAVAGGTGYTTGSPGTARLVSNGANASSSSFSYSLAPTISSVTPGSSVTNGGDTITVTGTHFTPSSVVYVGTTLANNITYVDAQTLTFVTPAVHLSIQKALDVTVQDEYGQKAVQSNAITYSLSAPNVTNLSQTKGPVSGGQEFTINGSGFIDAGSQVTQFSMGLNATCTTYLDQTLYCGGYNGYGQLGNGTTANALQPTKVALTGELIGKKFKKVSVGGQSTCAITTEGVLYCWGSNASGQLGNGSTTDSTLPVAVTTTNVTGDKTFTDVTVGQDYACSIASDKSVYCWGANGSGQVGNGLTASTYTTPQNITSSGGLSGKTVSSIGAGYAAACALTTTNLVYCWGSNNYGQVGVNTTTSIYRSPTALYTSGVLSGKTIASLSVGIIGSSSCVLTTDGFVYCWGLNTSSQLGNGSSTNSTQPVLLLTTNLPTDKTIKAVSMGSSNGCVIASDNRVYCWGPNSSSQIGDGTTTGRSIPYRTSTTFNKNVTSIQAGYLSACAMTADFQQYCWGFNAYGQTQPNSTANITTPTLRQSLNLGPAVTFDGVRAQQVTYISDTQLKVVNPYKPASTTQVKVQNYDGQSSAAADSYQFVAPLVSSQISPQNGSIAGGDQVTVTGSGFTVGMAIVVDGTTITPTFVDQSTLTFTMPVANVPGKVSVAVVDSYGQSVPVESGYTYQGAAPSITSITPPTGPVDGGQSISVAGQNFANTGQFATSISSSSSSSCVVYAQSTIYCAGSGVYGKLGNGTTSNSSSLVPVNMTGVLAGKSITDVESTINSSCALSTEGKVYCWGYNANGGLGNGTTVNSSVPTAVVDTGALADKKVAQLSLGNANGSTATACVVTTDGGGYCWGYAGGYMSGNGSSTTMTSPTQITMTGALAGKSLQKIAVGGSFVCALATDGTVACWGSNTYGQLGDRTKTGSAVPVAVKTDTALDNAHIVDVATGNDSVCVVDILGNTYCWGLGTDGQIGNNAYVSSGTPVQNNMYGALSGDKVLSLQANGDTFCATTQSNSVVCWGDNTNGQVGINTAATRVGSPSAVDQTNLNGEKIKTLSASSASSQTFCGLSTLHHVFCWGYNNVGQVNDGTTTKRLRPTGTNAASVAPTLKLDNNNATDLAFIDGSSLSATTPAHVAGRVAATVTNYDGQQSTTSNTYTYATPATVTGSTPTSGPLAGGDTVMITGTNFTSDMTVLVDGQAVSNYQVVNQNTITFVTPAATTPGSKSVVVEDQYGQQFEATGGYTYMLPAPTISNITPAYGKATASTTVKITGDGFVKKSDSGTYYRVFFGDTEASSVAYVDEHTLTVAVPPQSPQTVDVKVTSDVGYSTTVTNGFRYTATSIRFTTAALSQQTGDVGKMTLSAYVGSTLTASTSDTTIQLSTSSTGGQFATDLNEDGSTRWNKTSVVLPAGQTSVDLWYRDSLSGRPVISTSAENGSLTSTQTETIATPFKFIVSGVSDPIKAGTPSSVTVRVVDQSNNARTDYAGTIHFTSTDPAAQLPPDYTFKPGDYGIKTFTNGVIMGTAGSSYIVRATDTLDGNITGQQNSITVTAAASGTISKLAIISEKQNIATGSYSAPISIQAQDNDGEAISVQNATSIYLYSTSGTMQFSTDATNWSSDTPYVVTIPAGTSTVNIYAKDSNTRTSTISARDLMSDSGDGTSGDSGWTNATQQIKTGISPATKLVVSGADAALTGERNTYTVTLQNDNGEVVTADSDIALRVDSDTTTGRFAIPADTGSDTQGPIEFSIAAGTSSTTFGFKDTTISNDTNYTTVTVADARPDTDTIRLQDGTKDVQIVSSIPSKIAVSAATNSVEAGEITPVTLTLLDSTNTVAPAIADMTADLKSSSQTGEYSLSNSTFSPVTKVTFARSQSTKTVYYRDTIAGTSTLSAANADLSSQNDQLQVTPSDVDHYKLTGPGVTPVALASDPYTVTLYDVYGNVTSAVNDETVYLYSSQNATKFDIDQNGTFTARSLTIRTGETSGQFYVKDGSFHNEATTVTVSDAATLDDPDTGVINDACNYTVVSQPVAKLAFTTSAQTIRAGNASNTLTVELQKADGSPAVQDGSTEVSLSIAVGKLIANDGSVNDEPLASISVAKGESSVSFKYTGTESGMYSISASAAGVSTSQQMTVSPDAPVRIRISSLPQTLSPHTVSGEISFEIRDQYGNLAPSNSDQVITFSSTCTTGAFSVTASPWNAVTETTLAAGETMGSVYYKDSTPGTCALSIESGDLVAASQSIHITSYDVASMTYTTDAQTITAGETTQMMTVSLKTGDGEPAVQDGTTAVAVSAPYGSFVRDGDNGQETASSIPVPAGASSVQFYYTGTKAGVFAVKASIGVVSISQNVTVTPAEATKLAFTTDAQTVIAGAPTSEIHVAMQDQYSNETALAAEATLALASNCASGRFSESLDPWTPTESLALQAGASTATFYYLSNNVGTCHVNVTMDGLDGAGQDVTVQDGTHPVSYRLDTQGTSFTKGQAIPVSLSLLDQEGNVTPAKVSTTISFSTSTTTGSFDHESVTLQAGQSTATVHFTETAAGQTIIRAHELTRSLADQSATLTYSDGAVQALEVSSNSSVRVNERIAVKVETTNSYGVPVAVSAPTTVQLDSTNQIGQFYEQASGGDVVTETTIAAGQSAKTVYYTQMKAENVTVTAQTDALSSGEATFTVLPGDVASMRFTNAAYTNARSLEIGQSGLYKVSLYDAYGNLAPTASTLTLYAHSSNQNGGLSGNGRFTIPGGSATGQFNYSQRLSGDYEITVDDVADQSSPDVGLSKITQQGSVIPGAVASFRFAPQNLSMVRGETAGPVKLELLNASGEPVTAQDRININLSSNGGGSFARSSNGSYTSTLSVTFLEGMSSASFYYKNNNGTVNGQAYNITGSALIDNVAQSHTLPVTLSYGAATKLVFTNVAKNQEANAPSAALTVERQNQYGIVVPADVDTPLYVRSNTQTGQFTSDKVRWDASQIVMPAGDAAVTFYYKDTVAGAVSLTVADSLPFTVDTGLKNATQNFTVTAQAQPPKPVDNFLVTNIADPQSQGTRSTLLVVARDADGFVVSSYRGRIHFSSTDASAKLPTDYTFSSNDRGVATFANGVAFGKVGEQTVTVTDENGVAGAQDAITVIDPNQNPVAAVAFTQFEAVTVAPNKASQVLSVELRDASGVPTVALTSTPIRYTTSSSTGQFALTSTGPWSHELVTSVPAGFTFANVYYKDNTLGAATLAVSDWAGAVDQAVIENDTLQVAINSIYLEGEYALQSKDVFGAFTNSSMLFSSTPEGVIDGKVTNTFRSYALQDNSLAATNWRLEWRQGVQVAKNDAEQSKSDVTFAVNDIHTTAGSTDYFATAQATETSFDNPYSVVSKQHRIAVSPWTSDAGVLTVHPDVSTIVVAPQYRNAGQQAQPESVGMYIVPTDALAKKNAVRSFGVMNPKSGTYDSLDISGLDASKKYVLLIETYAADGSVTSQALSRTFTLTTNDVPGSEIPGGAETPVGSENETVSPNIPVYAPGNRGVQAEEGTITNPEILPPTMPEVPENADGKVTQKPTTMALHVTKPQEVVAIAATSLTVIGVVFGIAQEVLRYARLHKLVGMPLVMGRFDKKHRKEIKTGARVTVFFWIAVALSVAFTVVLLLVVNHVIPMPPIWVLITGVVVLLGYFSLRHRYLHNEKSYIDAKTENIRT